MANVTFTFNPTPAPACYPADVNGLAQQLTTGGMLSGTIPDSAGGGIFVSQTQPPSANTTKVWFRVDAAGRPTGIFQFYNGNWRKVYTAAALGEIRMYFGTNTAFDGTGRGIVGGELDGWALCNGNNGTPNMVNFGVKAGVRGTDAGAGYGDGWFSTAEDGHTWRTAGGAVGPHVINRLNLPPLLVSAYGTKQGAADGNQMFYVSGPSSGGQIMETWAVEGTQNSPNNPMPFEQYIVLGFMMFVGYQ